MRPKLQDLLGIMRKRWKAQKGFAMVEVFSFLMGLGTAISAVLAACVIWLSMEVENV